MHCKISGLAAAIALASIGATATSHAAEFRVTKRPIRGEYIVVLKPAAAALQGETRTAKADGVATVAGRMAGRHGFTVKRSYNAALRGFLVKANDASLAKLLADPNVAYVEENGYSSSAATQSSPPSWGLDRIDQRNLPLSASYTYDTTASGVHAYIFDSGINGSHSDFSGRIGTSKNFVTAEPSVSPTTDCLGHGTHVAGTVGGTAYGVAKGVTLHAVRVLSCSDSAAYSDQVAGIDWVIANHVKPAVANMSLGNGSSTAVDDALTRLVNAGVTVVVAAGNNTGNACNYTPARVPSVITVGSVDKTDTKASDSNTGTCLDIWGPGVSIVSANNTGTSGSRVMSGTSMASPHVAGIAALYLANNPTATPSQVLTALKNNATQNKVINAGTGSPNLLVHSLFGTTPPPSGNVLTSGVAVSLPAVATGSTSATYTISVPAGKTSVVFNTSGGSGDGDLYVKLGSAPTTSSYGCRKDGPTNTETCTFNSPTAGTYYVNVYAYAGFSGLSLKATISP